MRSVHTRQTLKLRMLAFVLTLALIWYSLNPAPRAVIHKKQAEEPPDEKRQTVEPQGVPATLPIAFRQLEEPAETLPPSDAGKDDFEWPEFIDG